MKTFKSISMIAAVTLMISGCGASKTNSAPINSYTPSLEVNATVNEDVATLEFTTDLTLSKEHYDRERKQGEGHIHVSLDQGDKIMITDKQKILDHLSKGPHNVKVSLHNNDHTPYDVSKTINFEVK